VRREKPKMADKDQDLGSEEEIEEKPVVEETEDDEEEESPFSIKIEDEEEEEEEGTEKKGKGKKKEPEPDEKDTKIADLEKKVKDLEKDKKRAFYEARQVKKTPETTPPGAKLTDSQIKQILVDNKDDPDTLMNVVKYIAEESARGVSTETVNAAEMTRKKGELDGFLAERYPDIDTPGSDIRIEVDKAKKDLGMEKHPFGDYFAVASRVLEDLPDLLENAYKKGKGETGTEDAEDKRKKDIASKKLPASKKRSVTGEELTGTQAEAAKQLGLTKGQEKIYKKLVAKKPQAVSVEE